MIWLALMLRFLILVLLYVFLYRLLSQARAAWPQGEGAAGLVVTVAAAGELPLKPGEEWTFEQEVVFGRGAGCTVNLPDLHVSSRHARIFNKRGRYYVEDLGSRNGTLLNGKPLLAPRCIKEGDRLQIGRTVFSLEPRQRKEERKHLLSLSVYPGLILAAGGLVLYLNQMLPDRGLLLLMAIAVLLTGSTLAYQLLSRGDHYLPLMVGVLTAIGLVFLYRINPAFGMRQSWWVMIGIGVFWLARLFLKHYDHLSDYKYLIMALGVFFLFLTILLGTEAGGARSWLALGSFRFQPSELVKLLMVIFLAGYLDENREILTRGTRMIGPFWVPDWSYLAPLLMACGLSLVLLVFQKDLGMALLFFSVFLAMFYAATGRFSYLVIGISLFALGVVLMYQIFPHVQERFAVFIDPWSRADAGGYQLVQSLFALTGGGACGWGLGSGFPGLIPAVHTDFIFSLLGEELGLMGTLAIVVIYVVLVWRGLRISLMTEGGFGRLLAFGFSALLGLQALIILGGVSDLIPLTGIPLPFLSYGGSSFVSNCFLIGVLTRISEGA